MSDIDIDKWPPLFQWAMGLGLFVGGALASWFGHVAARSRRSGDDDDEMDRLRADARDERLRRERDAKLAALHQECTAMVSDARTASATTIEAIKTSMMDEVRARRLEIDARLRELDATLRNIERRCLACEMDIKNMRRGGDRR